MEKILDDISTNLQKGKANEVKELVQQAIDAGIDPQTILNQGLLSGMDVIGKKFRENLIYVPDVLIAARAMQFGTSVLKPLLAGPDTVSNGKVVLGTVKGDLHDIGKNLVGMMMEGKGLEVIDLGVDVPAKKFIESAIEHNADIIGCSALLTTTMREIRTIVNEAVEAGIRDKVIIMIGGAPVTEDFANDVKADYYTPDAATAAEVALSAIS